MMNAEEKEEGDDLHPPPPYMPPPYDTTASAAGFPASAVSGHGAVGAQVPASAWPSMPPAYSADNNGFDPQRPGQFGPPPVGGGQVNQAYVPQYPVQMYPPRGQYSMGQQQHLVVVQQPGPQVWTGAPLENPPDDHMCYSIFVTLCCCWLVGIFAIARSNECRAAIAAGDRVTAEFKSREARAKANMALGLGILSLFICGAIIGVYYGVLFRRPY